jgi:hypothetical protein
MLPLFVAPLSGSGPTLTCDDIANFALHDAIPLRGSIFGTSLSAGSRGNWLEVIASPAIMKSEPNM